MSGQLDYSTMEQVEEGLERNERIYQEHYRRAQDGEMSGEVFALLCASSTQERTLLQSRRYILSLLEKK